MIVSYVISENAEYTKLLISILRVNQVNIEKKNMSSLTFGHMILIFATLMTKNVCHMCNLNDELWTFFTTFTFFSKFSQIIGRICLGTIIYFWINFVIWRICLYWVKIICKNCRTPRPRYSPMFDPRKDNTLKKLNSLLLIVLILTVWSK